MPFHDTYIPGSPQHDVSFYLIFRLPFFFKQKTAYEIASCLVGSEMCIRDRLDKYGLSSPVSSTTVHSWMVKLGCTYDRAGQSYYTDGHERKDVVEYRKEYVRAKRRHALRQPCWKRVEWEPLTADEKSSFDALVESEDKHLSEVIRFKD